MNIKIENYLLSPEPNAPTRWNLAKRNVVKSGKTKGVERFVNIAYGITLTHAVEIMAGEDLADNDSVVSMNEFLAEYKKTYEKFRLLISKEEPK